MQRQGYFNFFRIWTGFNLFLAVFLAVAISSYAACTIGYVGSSVCDGNISCFYTVTECQGGCNTSCDNLSPCLSKAVTSYGGQYSVLEGLLVSGCSVQNYDGCNHGARTCYYSTRKIVTKCQADSVSCFMKNFLWNSATCTCDDPQYCAADKAACQGFGGKWTGTTAPDPEGGTCCKSHCNTCDSPSFQDITKEKIRICCQQGYAPPEDTAMCAPFNTPVQQACGMSTSKINVNSGAWTCYAPNDAETIARYNRMCLSSSSGDGSSSSGGGSSSSGGGSSSSGGGSSSSGSQYPEGCPECPWLDSILDTLTRQKWIVQDIYDCLLMPSICGLDNKNERDTIDFAVDTGLIHIVFKPYMDSSLKLDSGQLRELIQVDSSLRYIIRLDSALLKADSVTRKAIIGGLLENDSTVDALNDSTRKWLRRLSDSLRVYNDSNRLYLGYIADSIGISVDSLITHIDSIKRNIPKDVFDSILKYQKQLAESDDSVIVDGLPALDSLIDSSLKYWKIGLGYDSIYNSVFKDSIQSIHDAISDIAGSVGYSLGYGDTASSTLRGDINALSGKFDGAAVDSNSVVFANGWIEKGESLGDSIGRAVGWIDGLDGVDIDSVYNVIGSGSSINSDSIVAVVGDSLNSLSDSLASVLGSQNDSIRAVLPESLTVWADSIRAYSPFASFDSLVFGSLGAKIPNSNECPDDCQRWGVNLPRFGLVQFDVDFGLCLGRSYMGGMNVLGLIRLFVRIVVVWSCIWIVFNALVRRKD